MFCNVSPFLATNSVMDAGNSDDEEVDEAFSVARAAAALFWDAVKAVWVDV